MYEGKSLQLERERKRWDHRNPFKLPLMSQEAGWIEALELIKFAWESKSQ